MVYFNVDHFHRCPFEAQFKLAQSVRMQSLLQSIPVNAGSTRQLKAIFLCFLSTE